MLGLPKEGPEKNEDKYYDFIVPVTLGVAVNFGEREDLVFCGNFLLGTRGDLVN